MNLGLENQVALVVDAQTEIARAVAVALAREKALLALSVPDNSSMYHTEHYLLNQANISQGQFRGIIADPQNEQDIRRMVRETQRRQGLIGILVTSFQHQDVVNASSLEVDHITPALTRNFFSTIELTRGVLSHMRGLGTGRIINLLPLAALEKSPHNVLSSLSMVPILAYFRGLATELAPENITVNNIIYSDICADEETDELRRRIAYEMGADQRSEAVAARLREVEAENARNSPMKRMGQPEEVGDIVCMVASQRTSYMTGANIIVDGGKHHTYL